MIGGKPKLKEKLIDKTLSDSDEQFIFFNNHKEKKFQQQIEVQAILNSNNSHKVMVIIDKKSTLDYLCMKIAEQMEKFQEYANLEGLKAINLTKKAEKAMIKIPNSGELKDYLIGGDIIYCDLTTQEYWVKTNIKIFSNFSKMNISLDLKFRLETLLKKLKFLLIKLGTNFWIDYAKGQEDYFHYTFINAKFKTLKSKNNFDLNVNDINKSMGMESMKIKDVFDYNSEINCNVNIISLEELLFNELKNSPMDSNSNNKLRWNEFREMTFDMLNQNKKFNPEKQFIIKYIKRLIRLNTERNKKSFYIYNKNTVNKSNANNIFDEDEFLNAANENEFTNLIIGPEALEDLEQDKEKEYKMTQGTTNSEEGVKFFKTTNSEDNLANDEFENKKFEIRKKSGKSFLERSKIIHEFEKNHNSIDENEISFNDSQEHSALKVKNKKRSSFDDSELFISIPRPEKVVSKVTFGQCTGDISININLQGSNLDGNNLSNYADAIILDQQDNTETIDDSNKKNTTLRHTRGRSQKFTSIFSKMRDTSKYSNLCSEFKACLKNCKFFEVIENYSTFKLCKNTLERVCIPQFRDVNIQSEPIDTEIKNHSSFKNEEDGPISVNNKRILSFILILITIFIVVILIIFLSN